MNIVDLLQDLVLAGWRFWLDAGRLKYRAPKTAVSESLLRQLKQNKTSIIQLLENNPEKLNVCHLSYGQKALWFLWQLSPQNSAYNQSLPIRVRQKVEEDAWLQGCRRLVARHPLLRTTFPSKYGEPWQQVNPPGELDWLAIDASNWGNDKLIFEMVATHEQPFDLEKGPVVRFRWFSVAEQEHILLITMHHIVCDGWSLEIIRRELPILCDQGDSDDLTLLSLPYSYHDYVRWHQKVLERNEGQRWWQFWQEQLSGPLPILNLPTDHPRPLLQTYHGSAYAFMLPDELGKKIKTLAQMQGATLYETFLAVFFVLLYRFSGQKNLLVGSPTTGRSRAEFTSIIGYFVNPVVIRTTINQEQPFHAFLDDVRKSARQAVAHGDFPFPLLVEKLNPERDPDHSPIFDVTFNYLNRGAGANDTDNRQVETFDIPQADGKFDLTLTLLEENGAIRGSFGYNSDLFQRDTLRQLSSYFIAMLHNIVNDPDQSLASIPLQQVGVGTFRPAIKGRHIALQSGQMVHRLFEEQVAANAAAPAVSAGVITLSYAELDERVNYLASYLQDLGISLEDRVAICTGRSVEFVVAMLAVLKAGGAYVPLDPGHPQGILAYMMTHVGVSALLTQSALQSELPEIAAPTICLDVILAQPASGFQANHVDAAGLKNLAYVMYTSGSTGKPKGVAIDHTALANYVVSIIQDLAIIPKSNFALVSTFGADLGNTVIFPALCSGGCLHILPEEIRLDQKAFATYMQSKRIDYLKIVPSHLAALVDHMEPKQALPFKAVFLGGEGAVSSWVAHLQALAPNCHFFNHYGPTETTVGVLTHKVNPKNFPLVTPTLPLSKAVANTDVFLLDRDLQPVPVGMIGELYIGGQCLARGYFNDPERTKKNFIRVPIDQISGTSSRQQTILYKTGDLARQRSNGDIEILGRQDRQVNLRGYRVELEQIEAVLHEDPAVRQCAVLADKEGHQADHLIAYVVLKESMNEGTIHSKRLKHLHQHLQQNLPQYMVPGHMILLQEMPLTANGKLNTRALRQLDSQPLPKQEQEKIFPRDIAELKLGQIWSEALGLPRVGIRDDFFQLGGHSLLAVRVAGRIEEEFQQWIPLATLFTNPTIEKLASFLRSPAGEAAASVLMPLRAQGAKPPLFCLPGAGGSVMYFADLARHLGSDQPVWGLQALGLNAGEPIPNRIEEVASRYIEIVRKKIQPTGPYHFVGHSFGGLVAFEMVRQLLAQGQSVAFLGVLDNAAPNIESAERYANYGHSEWLLHIAIRIGKLNQTDLHLEAGDFSGKTYDEQTEFLIDRLITKGLLPVGLNKTYFSRFVEVYKANAYAAVHYQPEQTPLPIGITLFKGVQEDSELQGQTRFEGLAWGWSNYTTEQVEILEVPGTHLTMFSEPHVKKLGSSLQRCMA